MTRRILVVEDDPAFAALVDSALVDKGFLVIHAPSRRRAEQLETTSPPDAAVVDIMLPDGSGAALVGHWRDLGREFPIVLMTGMGLHDRDVESIAVRWRLSAVLRKPVDMAHLAQVVQSAVASPEDALAASPSAASTFRFRFAELRRSFAAKLSARLMELEDAVSRARADGAERRRAVELAHKLHGTAGSYGFGEVSRAAGAIETELGKAPDRPIDDEHWHIVQLALHDARAASGSGS